MSRPKIRKINTSERKKKRKDLEKQLAKATATMVDHPKECCVCGGVFERTKTTVKTWMVTIIEKRTRLTCPECWATVHEALEVYNDS